jgi:hypothetical protein
MEVLHIARVRRIAQGKSIDGVAQTINIVVLDLASNKPSIVRNYSQFLQDLKNSFLIDDNVNSMNHPQVTKVLRGLKRGTVSGEVTFAKKGDKYKVTAESRVITDSSHPEFGKWNIGDIRIAEEDRAIIEGFLDIEPSEQFQTVQAVADATAQAKLAMQGAFEDFGISSSTSTVVDAIDDIPEDALAEALIDKAKK